MFTSLLSAFFPFSNTLFLGNVLLSEVEEARLLLDTAERARKHVETDINEVRENMANLSTTNSIISTDKRRLEGDLRGMQQELDNYMAQIKNSEEKTKKAMADAGNYYLLRKKGLLFFESICLARLAEELRTEQEHGLSADKALKTMSAQSIELASRLEDVETTALRHGRKIVAKLEERVRLLENELCKCTCSVLFDVISHHAH